MSGMIRLHITLLFVFLLAGIQMSQAQETVVLAVGQYGDLVFTEDTTTGDVVIPSEGCRTCLCWRE